MRYLRRPLSGACDKQRYRRLTGGLGAVVFDPVDRAVSWAAARPEWSTLLRFWPRDRKTYISQLELLAAVAAYSTYPHLFAGRRVHHFIDNTAALSALVHGYSQKTEMALMVNAFYLQLTGLRASVYFDYVPSKANIADLPSRNAFAELRAALLSPAPFPGAPEDDHKLRVPALSAWDRPLEDWIKDHSFPDAEWPV